MKDIELRILDSNGDHLLIKAKAVIAIVETQNGFALDIRENGELSEEWWRQFPKVMQDTMESGLEARRSAHKR